MILPGTLFAQGVKGTITDQQGEPLAFATLYIKELGTGTTANIDGYYEKKLQPGTYNMVFQYLGNEAVTRTVQVKEDFEVLNIRMQPQAIQLREVEVKAKAEDPAYTIIRKAISKSKFHQMQVLRYTANVYIKGGGRVKDVPFFLRKKLKEEGIDSSTVFLTESVSEIIFEQPNKMTERVISVRQVGSDSSSSPNSYIFGSFYEPEIAGSVSPLSPRAFSYYRFKLEGSYFDRGFEVNKIRVIPRSRGDDVFAGTIYIIEDLWSIHSLDLYTYKQGFKFDVAQIYAPVATEVWLPVSHQFEVTGKFLGFDVEFDYLATVSDYNIELNPDLKVDFVVVDEKIEKELARVLEKEEAMADIGQENAEEVFVEKKRFTRKELKKALKNYEAQLEEETIDEPNVVYSSNFSVDSLAYKRDSSYWEEVRPVPLSKMERQSYVKFDSMAEVRAREAEADTLEDGNQRKRSGSDFGKVYEALFFGKRFKLGKKTWFNYTSPLMRSNYNTVEGYSFTMPLELGYKINKQKQLTFEPTLRYAFARERLSGKGALRYKFTNDNRQRGEILLEGGRYIRQFNAAGAIDPNINAISTLFWERNWLKLYEEDFVRGSYRQKLSDKFSLALGAGWSERHQLFNNADRVWFDNDDRVFMPNAPANIELGDISFPRHHAFTTFIEAELKPFIKYRVRNGNKRMVPYSSPAFKMQYRQGIEGPFNSVVNFSQVQLNVKHRVEFGVRGRLDFDLFAGSFLNNEQLYFMDFQHFPGNRTVLQASDPVGSYRLLDYYFNSTMQDYVGGFAFYQFRKFLLTRIFEVQLLGLKENILFNYLHTGATGHYMEAGYSLDNIFRFFRVEAVASFVDGKYQDFGVRVGISTSIENLVNF